MGGKWEPLSIEIGFTFLRHFFRTTLVPPVEHHSWCQAEGGSCGRSSKSLWTNLFVRPWKLPQTATSFGLTPSFITTKNRMSAKSQDRTIYLLPSMPTNKPATKAEPTPTRWAACLVWKSLLLAAKKMVKIAKRNRMVLSIEGSVRRSLSLMVGMVIRKRRGVL